MDEGSGTVYLGVLGNVGLVSERLLIVVVCMYVLPC